MEGQNKRGRIGAAAAVLYVAVWIALMFLVSYTYTEPALGEGILIDFGDTDNAAGPSDPAEVSTVADATDFHEPVENDPDNILTQDFEEAPAVVQPENRTEQTAAPAEREVNRRALFPGRTESSSSTSEGTGTGAGNQGNPDGSPEGSHDGTGAGAGGTGFDLAGRSVLGSLPSPVYGSNKQGRVVIEITVDPGGTVINVRYRAQGSTTNDSELVNAAIRAARQSRFNVIQTDELQTGTITYNFKLK